MSGKGTTGHNVRHDLLPAEHKIVRGLTRGRLFVMAPGEDEIPMRRNEADANRLAEIGSDDEEDHVEPALATKKKKDPTPLQQSALDFMSQSTEERATASLFKMKWGKLQHEVIEWEILADGVDIVDNPMVCSEEIHMKKTIDFGSESLDDTFFNHFFPCVEGHGRKLDEFFKDTRALCHLTAKDDKIMFNQPEDEDPDWAVKQCCLLLIAYVTEVVQGVDNLWM